MNPGLGTRPEETPAAVGQANGLLLEQIDYLLSAPPVGWKSATMGEIADVVGGGTPNASDPGNFAEDGYPWVTPADLSGHRDVYISRGRRGLSEKGLRACSAKVMPTGAVLMSSRAPIGYVAVASNPLCTNQGFKSFVLKPGVDPTFVYYWLVFINPLLQSMGSGSTFAEISGARAKQVPVLVPPVAEQCRIAAKLGALLARINAARDRLARVPAILKRFRQSVLAAACSGRLTEDWRAAYPKAQSMAEVLAALRAVHERVGTGKRGNAAPPSEDVHDLEAADLPDSWVVSELKWLCQPERPITYGILKPGPHREDGVLYVRVADYPNEKLVLNSIKRTSREIAAEYQRASLRAGDLLLAIRGTFGRVCQVPPELDGGNLTQDTARIAVADCLDPAYVATFLRSPAVQDRLQRAAKGVAVRGVNIGDVRAVQVALPPIVEQREVVRRVDALFALADTIEQRTATALRRADCLTHSILSKAFQGELLATGVPVSSGCGSAPGENDGR